MDIGLRSTKMRTYDNQLLNIPNGYLANSRIQNYTQPNPKIRVVVEFGVEYGTNVDKVRKAVVKEISSISDVILENPEPNCVFIEMGDFALKFKALFWVKNWQEAYGKKLEATEKIYNLLNKLKIGIPYPTQTIELKK